MDQASRKRQRGATGIEYALMASAIGIALVVAVFTMGDSLVAMFDSLAASAADMTDKM